jgi:hypothetical protein
MATLEKILRRKHWLVLPGLLILAAALLIAAPSDTHAQGLPGANCPAVVERALESIDERCTGLDRNESCYGYNRVDALFWQENTDLVFNNPSDRVPLVELQRIATAPLNVSNGLWGVAALHMHSPDLPQTLPGQAVMFLLMGDTTLENNIAPEDAAEPIIPVRSQTITRSALYTFPTTTANTVGSIPTGTALQIVGQDETASWLEILLTDGSRAWIMQDATSAEAADLADLPITYGTDIEPRYGPMQSFYFTTGLAGPLCNEAPDALVVQTPDGIEVAFNINNLDVRIGSTVAFTTVEAGDGSGRRVMIGVLFEGRMEIMLNGQLIVLDTPGQSFAITLNEDGLVDENSELLRMGADPLSALITNTCTNAIDSGMFSTQAIAGVCGSELTYYTESGFQVALGLPANLPALGQQSQPQNNQPPAVAPPVQPPAAPPVVAEPPFQWPQITRPASGVELVGGGSHLTIWTPTEGASSYRLEVFPDTTNLEGEFLSYTTSDTQYDMPLNPMTSRPFPGWGYFMRVIPLNANGQPMRPVDQAPLTWVVRLTPEATPPPPPPPVIEEEEEEPEYPIEDPVDESEEFDPLANCEEVCEGEYCTYYCPDEVICYTVCDGEECYLMCE